MTSFNRLHVVVDSAKDDPRAKQLSTGKKKFNIDPDKVSQMFLFGCTWLYGYRLWPLRWPNTVFAHALANTIQQSLTSITKTNMPLIQ